MGGIRMKKLLIASLLLALAVAVTACGSFRQPASPESKDVIQSLDYNPAVDPKALFK